MVSISTLLAPLLSMVSFYSKPFSPIALTKKALAAALSRFSDNIKPTVSPFLSTARS
jgi:hypothetical protein